MVDHGACDGTDPRQLCNHAELSFATPPLDHLAGLALSRLQNTAQAARFGAGGVMGCAAWQLPLLRRFHRVAIYPDRNRAGVPIDDGFHPPWLHALAAVSAGSDRGVHHRARRLAGASKHLKGGGRNRSKVEKTLHETPAAQYDPSFERLHMSPAARYVRPCKVLTSNGEYQIAGFSHPFVTRQKL